MTRLDRRSVIAALLGWPLAALPGCSRSRLPAAGDLKHTNFRMGHRIRDQLDAPLDASSFARVPVVIVGGGIAGLTAGWRLKRAGFDDFALLELESLAGGTARGERRGAMAYPWGAHYIPAPMADHAPLIELLRELGVVERMGDDGHPIIGEHFLCRDPQERLFIGETWHEGIYPAEGADEEDLRQLAAFRAEIDRWVAARDESGRRMFAVPMANGSNSEEVRALDRISMKQWLEDHRWDSPRLHWLVDYACRDDYGLSIDRVSAWAGLFYFAARVAAPGQESQSVITWPEGNGRVVDHFIQQLGDHLRCGVAVRRIAPPGSGENSFDGPLAVETIETRTAQPSGWLADQVIFAAPQMLAGYLIRDSSGKAVRSQPEFSYGSWVVANVHLQDRPAETGFPLCWDNVLFDSRSLGYVTATHQQGIDHGPTVLTWYHPMADVESGETRKRMLTLTWSDWAEIVIGDLCQAHPDLPGLVTRLDVMLWGHAMIQPRVGFVWSPARVAAAEPLGAIHFAGTDLSGIALFEEAFHHGIRAAEEVLDRLQYP